MKTVQKIKLARLAYRLLHFTRALAGRSDSLVAKRLGANFELDLSQGVDLAIFLNFFERQTRRALRDLVEPGTTVLDIGANVGAHTLHLAQLVGPNGCVLAFEPTDFAFAKLGRNLRLNPDFAGRIRPFQYFLAGHDQSALPQDVYSAWPMNDEDGLHAKHLGRVERTQGATVRSLDSVLSEVRTMPIRTIKMDVDGFECSILSGATTLLKEERPSFVMEIAPYALDERSTSLEELLSFFLPNGYVLFDESTRQKLPGNAAALRDIIGDGGSINVIARPV